MSLSNRFFFFFFGILLGVLVLIVSLKGREEPISFNYFPNSRIINYLLQSDISISDKALCKINCLNLNTSLLSEYISGSKVDFKNSQIRGYTIKTYYLFNKINFHHFDKNIFINLSFNIQIIEDSVHLVDIYLDLSPHPNSAPFTKEYLSCYFTDC